MFEKVEVPVLGIVENMSMHICSNCGHHEPIFGTGGAENWRRSITPSCWDRCRCTSRCVKIWIAGNRRSSTARTVSLRSCTVSWRGALRRSFTGRVKSFWRNRLPRGVILLRLSAGWRFAYPAYKWHHHVGRVRRSRHPTKSTARPHHLIPTGKVLKRCAPHVHQAGEREDKENRHPQHQMNAEDRRHAAQHF